MIPADQEVREAIGPIVDRVATRSNQGYVDRLRRARSWVAAADLHADDLDIRLLCLWIAVNAMFGGFSTRSGRGHQPPGSGRTPIDYVELDLREFAMKIVGLDHEQRLVKAIRATGAAMERVLRDKWHFSPYWNAGTTPSLEALLRRTASFAKEAVASPVQTEKGVSLDGELHAM